MVPFTVGIGRLRHLTPTSIPTATATATPTPTPTQPQPQPHQPGHVKYDEARRRVKFFANSLKMDMPYAPSPYKALPFTTLTPYYNEEVGLEVNGLGIWLSEGLVLEFDLGFGF